MPAPYRSHSSYLLERFGEKVRRLSLDAGFTCPHRKGGRGAGGCSYCDSRGSGTGAMDAGMSVKHQGRDQIEKLSRKGVGKYIAYFQAYTGTAAPAVKLKEVYKEILRLKGVLGLTVSTRPDALPDSVLELLASFAPGGSEKTDLDVWVEIGLQSAHDRTLRLVNRQHDAACFHDAVRRAAAHGLKTAAHIILGLPGESKEDMFETADRLAHLPLQGIKLHHLYITKDAPLADAWSRNEIGTLTLDEYIPLAIGFLRRLRPDMVVMRLCGSAPRDSLLAPCWKLGNSEISREIAQRMIKSGWRQGDMWTAPEKQPG